MPTATAHRGTFRLKVIRGTGKVALSHANGCGKVSHYVVRVGNLATEHPDMRREFKDGRGLKPALVRANIHAQRLRAKGWPARIDPVPSR